MMDLFYQGGTLFMGMLTIILIVMIVASIMNAVQIFSGKVTEAEAKARKIGYTRSIGLFALVIGLLGQLIGLFSAFQAIEIGAIHVSPAILAAGFKVSMITTVYGVIIYALSFVIWFGLSAAIDRK